MRRRSDRARRQLQQARRQFAPWRGRSAPIAVRRSSLAPVRRFAVALVGRDAAAAGRSTPARAPRTPPPRAASPTAGIVTRTVAIVGDANQVATGAGMADEDRTEQGSAGSGIWLGSGSRFTFGFEVGDRRLRFEVQRQLASVAAVDDEAALAEALGERRFHLHRPGVRHRVQVLVQPRDQPLAAARHDAPRTCSPRL